MNITIQAKHIPRGEYQLVFSSYFGGGTALVLLDLNGERVCTLTSNISAYVPAGHVFIKSYSENEGVLEALVTAGAVEDTCVTVPTGYAEVNLCKLLVQHDGSQVVA